ncbi:hypothetical protein Salat_1480300 [Sesamum alatum]|uniref:Uncharacterized protein n=1 Tax=Sesamum alatum TaxID=300844 RepID=A0AAE2CMA0_9LAMI|nr:hypothetical protein Salat_1480300 [Sesamum alatum]
MGNDLPNPSFETACLSNLSTLLDISDHSCIKEGQDWATYEGNFSKFTFLLLEDIDLRYLTAHHPDCFPNLQFLFIQHCYKLRRIPLRVGYRLIVLLSTNQAS